MLLYIADALSRSPREEKAYETKPCNDLHEKVECYVNAALVTLPASDQRLDKIHSEMKNDAALKLVIQYVQKGWPAKRKVYGPMTKYWAERGDISLHNGLLLRGRRLITPPKLWPDVFRRLHDGHPGVTKTRTSAASPVWWPGINQDITKVVQNCATCEKYRKERIEPMKENEFPDRSCARVDVDIFQHKDKNCIIAVGYFSKVVKISKLSRNVNAAQAISQLKRIFSRHGIHDILDHKRKKKGVPCLNESQL